MDYAEAVQNFEAAVDFACAKARDNGLSDKEIASELRVYAVLVENGE